MSPSVELPELDPFVAPSKFAVVPSPGHDIRAGLEVN